MANEVRITVGADTKTADKALKSFRERLDGISAKARKVGIGLSAMGAGGVLAIKGFTSAALEQERAVNVLASVVDSAGESFADVEAKVMATTAALQRKTNFGDEAQIRVLAKLVPMLGSTDAALAALPAVMEVATVTGKDFSAVVDTMGPVLAGMTNRIRGTSLEFDASQGPMERVAHILETLGGAAEADIDPFIQMGNAMGDVKETIGSALLPIITPLIEKITRLAEWLQTINPAILKWGAVILAAATALGVLGGPLLIFLSFMPKMIFGLKGLALATKAWTLSLLANPAVLIFAAIAGAVALFATMWAKNMFGIRDKARVAFVAVGDFLINAINKMIRGLQMAARKMSFLLPQGVEDAIAGIKPLEIKAGEVFDAVVNKVDDMAAGVKDKFQGFIFAVDEGGEAAETFAGGMTESMGIATEAVKELNEEVASTGKPLKLSRLQDNLNTLGLSFDEAQERVFALVLAGADFEKAWEMVANEFDSQVNAKLRNVLKTFDEIKTGADDTGDSVENLAETAEAAAARIAAAFGSKAGALGMGSTLVGGGAGFEATALAGTAGLTPGSWAYQQAYSAGITKWVEETNAAIVAATSIPPMAHGGMIGGPEGAPSLAMVHGGELVLNRSQQAAMGSTFNITVNGNVDDPAQMARLIAEQVNQIMGESSIRNEATRSR